MREEEAGGERERESAKRINSGKGKEKERTVWKLKLHQRGI